MAKGKKKKNNRNIQQTEGKVVRDNTATKKVADLPNSKTAKVKEPRTKVAYHDILGKENLKWVGVGTAVLVIGYLLMIGGKSPDPNVYDEKALFSFVRISLAPILICLGFALQMYGIMKGTPKSIVADTIEEKVLEAQA